jgi:hypothetical protein
MRKKDDPVSARDQEAMKLTLVHLYKIKAVIGTTVIGRKEEREAE